LSRFTDIEEAKDWLLLYDPYDALPLVIRNQGDAICYLSTEAANWLWAGEISFRNDRHQDKHNWKEEGF
jgi:hypothetical protein